MDLRRLEHLLALAEERHFGRAADQASTLTKMDPGVLTES